MKNVNKEGERSLPSHLVPNLLARSYQKERPGKEEVFQECKERIELSKLLQRVDSQNPTWNYAEEFFEEFPKGPQKIWGLFHKWGVFNPNRRDLDKQLHTPENLKNASPREFMDLDAETIGALTNDRNITRRAEEARLSSWSQYHKLKNNYLAPGGNPLLCGDYVTTIASRNKPTCLIGLSLDEVIAYKKFHTKKGNSASFPPLVGINKGFSPEMKEEMENGRIISLEERGVIKVEDLKPGKVYTYQANITGGLPIKENQFAIGMLYVWHHIPIQDRTKFLKEAQGKAIGLNKGSGLFIFEPLSNRQLLQMVVGTNYWIGHPTALFDAAVGTTICGGQTKNSFRKELESSVSNLVCDIKTYPSLPPFSLFQNHILPYQQVGAIAC
jgi:hypothetical protein